MFMKVCLFPECSGLCDLQHESPARRIPAGSALPSPPRAGPRSRGFVLRGPGSCALPRLPPVLSLANNPPLFPPAPPAPSAGTVILSAPACSPAELRGHAGTGGPGTREQGPGLGLAASLPPRIGTEFGEAWEAGWILPSWLGKLRPVVWMCVLTVSFLHSDALTCKPC